MKIVAGLGSVDEYIPYVEAGADEFTPYTTSQNNTRKLLILLYGVCPLDLIALSSLIRRCFYICDRVESIVRST